MRSGDVPSITTIPVAGEELVVGREARETERVRVTTTVDHDTTELDVPTVHEEVEVERVAIGRIVDEPPRVRVEGDTTIVPVVEEMVVVEKRLFLREEVRITKHAVQETKHVREPVRREHVHIDRRKT